jgi:hypothetical protein
MPWFLNEECGRWYSQPTLGAHTWYILGYKWEFIWNGSECNICWTACPTYNLKENVKVNPWHVCDGIEGMWKYSSYPFATLPYKVVGGEHHTPGHFTPVKTWYPLYRRLGGPGTETSPCQNSFPKLSNVSIPITQYQPPVSILTTLYWLPEGHVKLCDDICIGLQLLPMFLL